MARRHPAAWAAASPDRRAARTRADSLGVRAALARRDAWVRMRLAEELTARSSQIGGTAGQPVAASAATSSRTRATKASHPKSRARRSAAAASVARQAGSAMSRSVWATSPSRVANR